MWDAVMQTARYQATQMNPDIMKFCSVIQDAGRIPQKKKGVSYMSTSIPTQVIYRQQRVFESSLNEKGIPLHKERDEKKIGHIGKS